MNQVCLLKVFFPPSNKAFNTVIPGRSRRAGGSVLDQFTLSRVSECNAPICQLSDGYPFLPIDLLIWIVNIYT